MPQLKINMSTSVWPCRFWNADASEAPWPMGLGHHVLTSRKLESYLDHEVKPNTRACICYSVRRCGGSKDSSCVPARKQIPDLKHDMSRVQWFINTGPRLRYGGNRLILKNNRIVHLSDEDDRPTAAGNEYEPRMGEQLLASGYQAQRPLREGTTQTIVLRAGKRAVSRRWNTEQNNMGFYEGRHRVLRVTTNNF